MHDKCGVSGPGVVRAALRKYPDADITKISDVIKEISYKITRVGQLVGTIASKRLGVPFGIVDLSLAPTPAVGDSVAHILEEIGLEKCGTHAQQQPSPCSMTQLKKRAAVRLAQE